MNFQKAEKRHIDHALQLGVSGAKLYRHASDGFDAGTAPAGIPGGDPSSQQL